jgi:hypothetical protein
MPTPIPYSATSVSQLKTPDVTKAGSIFSNAIKGLSKNISDIADTNIARAEGALQDQIRQAQTLGETEGITADPLRQLGADPARVQALEDTLKQQQSTILGKDINTSFDQQFATNTEAVLNTLESDPAYADVISVDESGNISATTPIGEPGSPEYALSKAQIDETIQRFNADVTAAGFSGIKTDRELARDIRAKADSIGATAEQKNALVNNAKAYRDSLNALSPEEQAIASQQAADIDAYIIRENQSLDAKAQRAYDTYGFSGEEASNELRTSRQDVNNYIDTNLGEAFILDFFESSGLDVKKLVSRFLDNGITIGARKAKVEPWMVQRALIDVRDATEGGEEVNDSDLKKRIFSIANSNAKSDLTRAARLGGDITAQKLANEQRAIQAKRKALSDLKKEVGIRDTAANRRFINQPEPVPAPIVKAAPLPDDSIAVPESTNPSALQRALTTGANVVNKTNENVVDSLQKVLDKVRAAPENQKLTKKQNEAIKQIEEFASP